MTVYQTSHVNKRARRLVVLDFDAWAAGIVAIEPSKT